MSRMPDCTSCSWVFRPRLSKKIEGLTLLVSHRGLTHTEDPKVVKNIKWLELVASFCPFPAVKTASRVRTFTMWDLAGPTQLDRIFSLVICTKKRLHENPIGRQHRRRSTQGWSSSSSPSKHEPESESSLANTVSAPK